jgi:SAM-dependent methyltransferase
MTQVTGNLREIARKVPPLYWLGGFINYLRFAQMLKKENRLYALQENPASPPPMLRYRVHRALDEASYLENGTNLASWIVKCMEDQGVPLDGMRILDFGCGPGRVACEMKKLALACDIYGSDIDREAIQWARNHRSDIATFTTNEPEPPTRYADNFFDLIYSVSLFTHLDEALQDAWLMELARILKPGGRLLASTHGRYTLASCTLEELEQLDEHGIVFRVDRKGRFKLDGLPDFYQTTFHSRDYVERRWSRFFEVVDHIDGGLGGHQDLIVLMRRPE